MKHFYFLNENLGMEEFYGLQLELGDFYGCGEIKTRAIEQKADENQGFPGRVIRIRRNIADCTILVGAVTLNLALPMSVLKPYQLERGDCFQFYPTENGRIDKSCIKPTERTKDILAEVGRWDPSELERLTMSLVVPAKQGEKND